MTELEFLKSKGLIKEGFTKFIVTGDFGKVELTELLKEYKTEQLRLYGVVGRSEQLKAEQEAYNSGYNDGAQAAANDILG